MASLLEFTFPGTVGGLQARPGSGWRGRETLGCRQVPVLTGGRTRGGPPGHRCGGGTEQGGRQMVGGRQLRWGPEVWAQLGWDFSLVIGSLWVLYQCEP